MSKKLFKNFFILLVVIGFLDLVANYFYFYWTIWWFDAMMHFLAGVCVGLAVIWILPYLTKSPRNPKVLVIFSFLGVLLVGLAWEVYELYFGITSTDDGFVFLVDTVSDMILDICGGLVAVVYSIKLFETK